MIREREREGMGGEVRESKTKHLKTCVPRPPCYRLNPLYLSHPGIVLLAPLE